MAICEKNRSELLERMGLEVGGQEQFTAKLEVIAKRAAEAKAAEEREAIEEAALASLESSVENLEMIPEAEVIE